MDENTQQLLDALEQRVGHVVRLQIKPLEDRQQEILAELKTRREQMQHLETDGALSNERIARYEKDLNHGLKRIREDMAENKLELKREFEKKMRDKSKYLAPAFTALAGVVSILVGVAVWILKS